MAQVYKVDNNKGVAEFVGWFKSWKEAERFCDEQEDKVWEYVPLEENEEFVFW